MGKSGTQKGKLLALTILMLFFLAAHDILAAIGDSCDQGSDCTYGGDCVATGSGSCTDTPQCQYASATYNGRCCSPNGNANYQYNYGIVTRDSGGTVWSCDSSIASYYSTQYYYDCGQSTGNSEACDSDSLAGGYGRTGECVGATCCTLGVASGEYLNGNYNNGNEVCQCQASTEGQTASCTPGSGPTDSGRCTYWPTNCCTNNVVDSGESTGTASFTDGDEYCGCSAVRNGYMCDPSALTFTSALAAEGLCVSGDTCDTGEICSAAGTIYNACTVANCDPASSAEYQCMTDAQNTGGPWSAGGLCTGSAAAEVCTANGAEICVDSAESSRLQGDCSYCVSGDPCDVILAGADYLRDGTCAGSVCANIAVVASTTSHECGTGLSGCAAADWTAGDEDSGCDTGNEGAICDASPDTGPTADGYCIEDACRTSGVGVLNCGTDGCAYAADLTDAKMTFTCTSTTGYACDSVIQTTGFAQDGICTTTGCDTAAPVATSGGSYYAACTANYACDNTITSGDFLQDGICYGASCCTSNSAIDGDQNGNADACAACSTSYNGDKYDSTLTNGAFSAEGRCAGTTYCTTNYVDANNNAAYDDAVCGCTSTYNGYRCASTASGNWNYRCIGATCSCNANAVDSNQDGIMDTCGCTTGNNGAICDANVDGTFDGICVDTTCDTVHPVELHCGTDGCTSADKGNPAYTSIQSNTGHSCGMVVPPYTNNFFTQNGMSTIDGCCNSPAVRLEGGTYYCGCGSTDNIPCDTTISTGGDYLQDGLCCGGVPRANGGGTACCSDSDCTSPPNVVCFNYLCTDVTSTNRFIIQNSSSAVKAFITSTGHLWALGNCTYGGTYCIASSPAFLVYNSSNNVTAFVNATGDLCVTGSISHPVATVACTSGLTIQNSAGTVEACFHSNGNLTLAGNLTCAGKPYLLTESSTTTTTTTTIPE